MSKKSCKVSFPVIVVGISICFIYFASVFVFIEQWFGLWSSPGLMNAVVFTFIAVMCVYSYIVAILTDPGQVPASFAPDVEDSSSPIQEVKRKSDDLRYCQKCLLYKPPRAHHCRICKRCVLRMDHHCIWINNCVGHSNYKLFFVFVLYAVTACLYSSVLLVGSIISDPVKEKQQNEGSSRSIYVISGLLVFPLTVALAVLLSWHIYLVLRNKTTIEYYEGVRALWLAVKGGEIYVHPYDIGTFENLTAALGSNILCWVCPTSRHLGSGLSFKTRYDNKSASK